MQKFAIVFPGQGSQKLGMLGEIATEYPQIKSTFEEASDELGIDLWEVTQQDSSNILDQTHITQPVLLVSSIAIWRLWVEKGAPMPALMAGHSLGEYSALVASDVIDFRDAVRIVHKRGQLMQQAVENQTGLMAAIVGLEKYQIQEICQKAAEGQVVSPANYNSPGQTVIAGNIEAVERAMELCKEAGARRALPLNVSVPCHCDLLQPASAELAREFQTVEFRQARIPVIQNLTAELAEKPGEIKESLLDQIYKPVQWDDTVKLMASAGVEKVIECGSGKVLCGLIKRSEPGIACFGTDTPVALDEAIGEVSA